MERLIMGMEREEMEVRAEVDRLSAGTEMQELAGELCEGIDNICGGFHYYKDENVLGRAKDLAGKISQFCSYFLQGNIFGLEDAEYMDFQTYILGVLEDYMEAIWQQDMVYMLDTLDYGLRELLDIYIGKEPEETRNGL